MIEGVVGDAVMVWISWLFIATYVRPHHGSAQTQPSCHIVPLGILYYYYYQQTRTFHFFSLAL